MCLFSNFIPEYCGWNVSSHLQSGWRGRPSLPTGLTSSWDQRGTHQSERFRLRLAPSEAQCPGQTGTNTRCLAAAGPEPPWSHTHTPQPTCWSEFFHFSETRRFPWIIQHSIFIVMDCQPVQVYFTPTPNPHLSQQKTKWLSSSHMQTFLVRKSTSMQRKVISVRMDHHTALPVQDFPVRENKFSMY